ncbi:PLP-dependent aminotransferase family protein [Stappia sp.]|uniref:MocR-like pyridoxine biosynthesis transcription factor PdxR n=1 Tax=Stappia sp. TaxID=1870903 RepID=UPI003A995E62
MLDGILSLDRDLPVPLPEQVYRGLRGAIGEGRFSTGTRLPSSRALATSLGISRNTVNAAYELLAAEGVVSVRPGSAPRVAEHGGLRPEGSAGEDGVQKIALSRRGRVMSADPWGKSGRRRGGRLEPGSPALDCFPKDAWAQTLRRAARNVRGRMMFYEETAGYPALRDALADYLTQDRGVRVTPGRVLVMPSTQASLQLVAQCLADPGDAAWIEDPGYLGARAAFRSAGLSVQPMPVDGQGADPSPLADGPSPKLIYVTPSHQYPHGMRMTLERRAMILDAARAHGAVVLEDDYDSEFLFSGRPLAAMQGLGADGEVIYLGTFSKSMLPGVRVAYMVVPEYLAGPLATAQRVSGMLASVVTQAALADFIVSGRYRAHLKRIQGIYQARGAALAGALRARLGGLASVADPVGGVQLALRFRDPVDDLEVARRVNQLGFGVASLSSYGIRCRQSGLVIGFAGLAEGDADDCALAIAGALEEGGLDKT